VGAKTIASKAPQPHPRVLLLNRIVLASLHDDLASGRSVTSLSPVPQPLITTIGQSLEQPSVNGGNGVSLAFGANWAKVRLEEEFSRPAVHRPRSSRVRTSSLDSCDELRFWLVPVEKDEHSEGL
jgi:hypothetical protein